MNQTKDPRNQTNPKLQQFLTRLAGGRYASISRARSALGGTKDLTDEDKAAAREALTEHFNPKRAKEAQPSVESIRKCFVNVNVFAAAGISQLLEAVQHGSFSEEDLVTLLTISLEEDNVAAFTTLFQRFSGQIAPSMLNVRLFAKSPQFFQLVGAICDAPVPPPRETFHVVVQVLISELQRRASDEEQVAAFEKLVSDLEGRAETIGVGPLTSLVISFARPVFVQHWLTKHQGNPEWLRTFVRRTLALYLLDETPSSSLLALVTAFDLECSIVEEIVRVLLAQRQLGDAIVIADVAPDAYKSQLYQILHPVVVRHGDVLSLTSFAIAFPEKVDRAEIKELVKKALKPDLEERLDAILDGEDPVDTFEAVPSMLSPEDAHPLRADLMRKLGLACEARPTLRPPFLNDLFDTIGRHTNRG